MIKFIKIGLLLAGIIFIPDGELWGQVSPPDTTANKQVIVDHSDIGEYIQEGGRQIQMLIKVDRQVELRQGDAYMYCDTAIIEENDVVAYGNVIIQQTDSVNVFADSLVYLGNQRIADLYGNVVLENGPQKLFTEELNYNLDTKVATYYLGAMLTNDSTQLTSKKGYYYVDEKVVYFKDSVVVIDEAFSLRADTLKYDTKTKVATFLGPTLISQDSARIYCEDGFYDTDKKLAEFKKNAQYVKGEQQATAKVIRYDGTLNQVLLIGDAKFVEGTKNASADTIRYNDNQDLVFLTGNAVYKDKGQYIVSDKIRYDSKTESVKTDGRSKIIDENQILMADKIDFDNNAQLGIAEGNVYWVDTIEQISISCETALYNKSTDYLKATGGRPMMTTLVDGDTLYLAADTLISYRPEKVVDTLSTLSDSAQIVNSILPDSTEIVNALPVVDSLALVGVMDTIQIDTIPPAEKEEPRNLIAQRNVMIYKSNMQAVCDSLSYSTADSLFQLFGQPIIWSDTSQFYAEVVHIQMANDKIDRILLYKNSFIINSPDEVFFNQIKGRDIVAFFEESEIRRVKVNGNAESIYYALDDNKAYVAVNKTVCSEMMLFFGNNEIESINFYRQPTATMYPMKQIDHKTLELPGFYWEKDKRPNSVKDLRKLPDLVSKIEEPPIE